MKLSNNFKNLPHNYLFNLIDEKFSEYKSKNPDADVIKLGIGDVTLPLCSSVIEESHKAVDEMAHVSTFKGYGPCTGYDFLKKAISIGYKSYGVDINEDEIYVSDGSKGDAANIQELFSLECTALIPDPVYPVYVDSNVLAGRKIEYMDAGESNDFLPLPPNPCKNRIIYLCSPNNPTGAVYNKTQLKKWVDYALENESIIIFDSAYECFIDDEDLPHSIFEVEGAKECAVELRSFSKSAGFTGVRCAYMVIPSQLEIDNVKLGRLWGRRQACKFNGVSYITQKAAWAAISNHGQCEVNKFTQYYKNNAKIISDALNSMNIWHIGGNNSPYIWLKCPGGMNSWEFFDYLLRKANILGVPGAGFGENGEGYLRLSAFGEVTRTTEAAERLKNLKL